MAFSSESKPIRPSAELTALASLPAAALENAKKASIKIGDGEGYADLLKTTTNAVDTDGDGDHDLIFCVWRSVILNMGRRRHADF